MPKNPQTITISEMKLSRRQILRFIKLSGFMPALWFGNESTAGALSFGQSSNPYSALPYWLDTLLPASHGPGALALNIHAALLSKADSNPRYASIIKQGCHWLDRQANAIAASDFAYLNDAQRIEIVTQAEQLSIPQLPKVFFLLSRHDAMRTYYSDPRSWHSLSYGGPPQPNGYIHQAKAPSHE